MRRRRRPQSIGRAPAEQAEADEDAEQHPPLGGSGRGLRPALDLRDREVPRALGEAAARERDRVDRRLRRQREGLVGRGDDQPHRVAGLEAVHDPGQRDLDRGRVRRVGREAGQGQRRDQAARQGRPAAGPDVVELGEERGRTRGRGDRDLHRRGADDLDRSVEGCALERGELPRDLQRRPAEGRGQRPQAGNGRQGRRGAAGRGHDRLGRAARARRSGARRAHPRPGRDSCRRRPSGCRPERRVRRWPRCRWARGTRSRCPGPPPRRAGGSRTSRPPGRAGRRRPGPRAPSRARRRTRRPSRRCRSPRCRGRWRRPARARTGSPGCPGRAGWGPRSGRGRRPGCSGPAPPRSPASASRWRRPSGTPRRCRRGSGRR